MAAYCAASDVQNLMPKFVFSETSKPSLDQVGAYIAMIDAQLRAALYAASYDPDALDAAALPLVKSWCAAGSTDMTTQAAFPSAPDTPSLYRDLYQAGLAMITKQSLPGLVISEDTLPLARSAENLSGIDPVFQQGIRQW